MLLFKGGVNSGDSFLPGLGVCLCLWAEAGYLVTGQVLRSLSWKPVASRAGTTSVGCLLHAEELAVVGPRAYGWCLLVGNVCCVVSLSIISSVLFCILPVTS